ncbi:MAG: DUF6788 family protein [Candidatus Uhrbacteria bacterium]
MKSVETRRQEKLALLGQDRPILAGSLSRIERKDKQGRTTVYHLLTFKQEGKTRSVYVPKDLVKEAERWIRNYRRIKKLLAEASILSINIIQKYVPEKRVGGAKSPKKKSNP